MILQSLLLSSYNCLSFTFQQLPYLVWLASSGISASLTTNLGIMSSSSLQYSTLKNKMREPFSCPSNTLQQVFVCRVILRLTILIKVLTSLMSFVFWRIVCIFQTSLQGMMLQVQTFHFVHACRCNQLKSKPVSTLH